MRSSSDHFHPGCCLCDSITEAKLKGLSRAFQNPHDAYFDNQVRSLRLWVIVSAIEMATRNRAAAALRKKYGDSIFGVDAHLLGVTAMRRVQKVLARFRTATPSVDQVITALPFSFWSLLFSKRLESTTWSLLRKEILTERAPKRRSEVYELLSEAVEIRNRIAHHESVHRFMPELAEKRLQILLGWLCPDFLIAVKRQLEDSLHPVE